MGDIDFWRRKIISTTRSRTPEPRRSKEYSDERLGDLKESLSSTSPRRIRPKLTSFFSTHSAVPQVTGEYEPFQQDQWSIEKPPERHHEPDIDLMVRTIHGKLLSEPHHPLSPDLNSLILHIIEHCGSLLTEKHRLLERLDEQNDKQGVLQRRLDEAARSWNTEKEAHLREIARLKGLLVEAGGIKSTLIERRRETFSYQGARPGMVSLDGHIQTTDEAVKNMLEDPVAGPTQLSVPLRYQLYDVPLSSKFFTSKFFTAGGKGPPHAVAHGYTDPLDTSRNPTKDIAAETRRKAISWEMDPTQASRKTHLSEDDYSSFSSAGEALPDEISEEQGSTDMSGDRDFAAVRRFAELMARRRATNVEFILPQVVDFFRTQTSLSRSSSKVDRRDKETSDNLTGELQSASPQVPFSSIDGAHSLRRSRKFKTASRPWSFLPGDDRECIVQGQRSRSVDVVGSQHHPDDHHLGANDGITRSSQVTHQSSPNAGQTTLERPSLSHNESNETAIYRGKDLTHIYGRAHSYRHASHASISSSSQTTVIQRSPLSTPATNKGMQSGNIVPDEETVGDHAVAAACSALASAKSEMEAYDR